MELPQIHQKYPNKLELHWIAPNTSYTNMMQTKQYLKVDESLCLWHVAPKTCDLGINKHTLPSNVYGLQSLPKRHFFIPMFYWHFLHPTCCTILSVWPISKYFEGKADIQAITILDQPCWYSMTLQATLWVVFTVGNFKSSVAEIHEIWKTRLTRLTLQLIRLVGLAIDCLL